MSVDMVQADTITWDRGPKQAAGRTAPAVDTHAAEVRAGQQPHAQAGDRPVTVLQVIPALETGGVERGTLDIAQALVEAGALPLVASCGGPMVKELERAGARHVTLPVDSKNPIVMYRNVARLVELIRAEGVDIVHARSRAPAWSARAAARACGVPLVTTWHGTYSENLPLKRRYNAIMAAGDRVIATSDFIADHIIARHPDVARKLVTVPRGVDLVRFNPQAVQPERLAALAKAWRLPDDRPLVMLPGRLTRWKGQEVMIEAIERLGRRDLTVLLVGADQGRKRYRDELVARIDAAGLGGVVRLVGNCSDMPAAYMLADVVVSASIEPEAFGRIAVEAQAMGRPMIATGHGGSRETVLDGETGWLVPPGDAQAMAETLALALDLDLDTRLALARRARGHIEANFSIAHMTAATLDVYRSLLTA
ncbi:glycosyltransferase family 4 protein [Zavarzinia sp. CC-PAN008]|uniref:glycosyltransferase family 4 protein n=1 Tax=Zavarzinia sp. CC-PAN008 TaxID=3243332 RepID=UPI003F74945F